VVTELAALQCIWEADGWIEGRTRLAGTGKLVDTFRVRLVGLPGRRFALNVSVAWLSNAALSFW
jgi:hypothetical protein